MDGRGGRRVASAVVCLLAPVLLGACSGGSGSSGAGAGPVAASSAAVATAADCQAPQVLAALGLTSGPAVPGAATPPGRVAHPDAPDAGAVPDGFTAASVLVCTRGGELRDAQGAWSSVTATQREGDLRALLVALDRPTSARTVTTGTAADCVPGPRAVQLWLVDVLGRAIRVATPDRACGVPVAAVTAALDALHVTDSSSFPVGLVASEP